MTYDVSYWDTAKRCEMEKSFATKEEADTFVVVGRKQHTISRTQIKTSIDHPRISMTDALANRGIDEAQAVKKLKAAMKRRINAPEKRKFPTWHAQMSMADYISQYYQLNNLRFKS